MRQVSGNQIREALENLIHADLSFRNGDRASTLHSLHAFAARFPAQLPRHFIEGLSNPGDLILDPMAGSGATMVEGWLLGRRVLGLDLDPLAVRLSKAKTTWIDPITIQAAGQRVLDNAWLSVQTGDPLPAFLQLLDEPTMKFLNFWFQEDTQRELAALAQAIRQEYDPTVRRMLEVLFSSVIVTKSGGVSMARDLAHSRPHRVADKVPASPLARFKTQVKRAQRAFMELSCRPSTDSSVLLSDCRQMPLTSASVDLIVTSPPYANALDYMRAHKFSLVWLDESVEWLGRHRAQYIGSERWREIEGVTLPVPVRECVACLAEQDPSKARVLDKYFKDISLAILEMHRVLRTGKAALIVVGPSTMRGLRIATHDYVAAISEQAGFEVVAVERRALDRDRRMMPARMDGNGHFGIENRIHEEFVIALLKP